MSTNSNKCDYQYKFLVEVNSIASNNSGHADMFGRSQLNVSLTVISVNTNMSGRGQLYDISLLTVISVITDINVWQKSTA